MDRSAPDAAELAYLFFALAFWPFWLPFSVTWIDRRHRRWNGLLAAMGIAIGLSLYLPVVAQADRFLHVTVSHHSIRYNLQVIPALRVIPEFVSRALYVAVIALPLLLWPSTAPSLWSCPPGLECYQSAGLLVCVFLGVVFVCRLAFILSVIVYYRLPDRVRRQPGLLPASGE